MTILNLFNKLNGYFVAALKHLAIWILAAMMFLTAVDVCMRYLFKSPVTGSFELVEFMMALLIPFSIVFCASENSHVQVDVIVERFPEKIRSFFMFAANLLSFVLFVLITWQAVIYIIEEYDSKLTSAVLYIPVYPFIGMLALAFAVLSFLLLAELINYLARTIFKWNQS
ncbi:TRAP transporter small permease [Thermodesulfobacteriota bacterium]